MGGDASDASAFFFLRNRQRPASDASRILVGAYIGRFGTQDYDEATFKRFWFLLICSKTNFTFAGAKFISCRLFSGFRFTLSAAGQWFVGRFRARRRRLAHDELIRCRTSSANADKRRFPTFNNWFCRHSHSSAKAGTTIIMLSLFGASRFEVVSLI